MGAGKTTIGASRARPQTGIPADSDNEIEQRTGADIPWIFDVEGEAGFREREEQVVDEMTQL
jgi:shikimate kinase